MDNTLSKTFDLLRFPLALLVVYLHISPTLIFDNEITRLTKDVYPTYYYINLCISTFANLAVPCFFVVSGYLLSFNIKYLSFKIYLKKLRSRFYTLFFPYITWNLLCVAYYFFTRQICFFPSFTQIFITPINFPLWFLRNLIVLNLIFPFFWFITKYLKIKFLIICIIGYMFTPIYLPPNIRWDLHFSILSALFFYVGVFSGYSKISFNKLNTIDRICLLSLGCISYIILIIIPSNCRGYILNIYLFSGAISLFLITYILIKRHDIKTIPYLAPASFFIYLSHKLGPTYISKKLLFFLPKGVEMTEIVTFLICPILTCAICIGTYILISKYSPKLLKLLTGK